VAIFSWTVLGLFAGLASRLIYSGPQPGGHVGTALLGLAGAVGGGLLEWALSGGGVNYYNGLTFFGVLWAGAGATGTLFLWGLATAGKTSGGVPD